MTTYIIPTLDPENTNRDVKTNLNTSVQYTPTSPDLKDSSEDKNTSNVYIRPLKAIRAKCLDCCGGSAKEVRLCTAKDCPLYLYRFGCKMETWVKRINKSHKDKIQFIKTIIGSKYRYIKLKKE